MVDVWGILLGSGISIATSAGTKVVEKWSVRKTIRGAIKAEIATFMELVELRQHRKTMQGIIANWKEGKEASLIMPGLADEKLPTFPVIMSNIDKIGLVGSDVCQDIVKFYTIMLGLKSDMKNLYEQKFEALGLNNRASLFDQDLQLFDEAALVAKKLIEKL